MPTMPDWLARAVNEAPHLVEDSPQFRKADNAQKEKNLHSAIDMAMEQIRIETEDQQRKAAEASIMEMQKMAPVPSAMENSTQFFDDEGDDGMQPLPEDKGRYVPGPSDFDVPPMAAAGTGDTASPEGSGFDEDPLATVEVIAQTLGITPQQVAALTMLGEDIRRNYVPEEQDAGPVDPLAQPATGNPPMPTPLAGPTPMTTPAPPVTPPGPPSPPPATPAPPSPMPSPLAGPPSVV